MKSRSILIFSVFVGIIATSSAAPLTWETALAEADRNNPDLASARAVVQGARADLKASYSPFLPQLSAEAGYSRSGDEDSTASESYSTSLSARQNLFSGGGDVGRMTQSRAALQIAEAAWDAARAALTFDLRSAFTRVLYAQEQLKLTRTIVERRKDNVRLVELRFEAGREHRGSFLRSSASYSQAAFEVAQAERALRVAQRELLRALGRSEFEALVVTGTFRVGTSYDLPAFETLVEKVPAYQQFVARTRSAEAGVTIARSGLLPALDARASTGRSGDDWPPDESSWSVGATLSYAFFPGARNYFAYKSAQAARREARANLISERNRVLLDLEANHADYVDSAQRSQVQAEFLTAAVVRAQIARSQYTSGLLTFDDWDVIENDLISTQKNYLSAQRDAVIAEASWTEAQGQGELP